MMINLPLEWAIGLRYVRSKRRDRSVSLISVISMIGIIIGVWAIITVMSIMNGFHKALKGRTLYAAPHITITEQNSQLRDWQALADAVKIYPEVEQSAPYILGEGMLTNKGRVTGVLIRGVDVALEKQVTPLFEHIREGNADLDDGSFNIMLGQVLADQLGVGIGDKVTVVAPKGKVTPTGLLPRLKRFTVTGLFYMDMYEYDSRLAIINLQDAAKFLGVGNNVSGLRLKLSDAELARTVRYKMYNELPLNFRINDWTQQNATFFNALEIEKRVVRIVMFIIFVVAAINIVSTLIMMVMDKQADVAILRTMGLSPNGVMKVFVVQGMFIGIIGTFIGAVLGVITALNVDTWIPAIEEMLGQKLFDPTVYLISQFPAQLQWPDVIWTVAAALIITFLATIYPSRKAAKLDPAEALRYE